ncbi:EamA family transporter [Campylobacter coli]|nr:EamA family transporter [Campylobacter coli]EIX7170144.1 EamA family transporter [Campylobacter coli]EMB5525814.1 EamA family transporter [Campylobacter coli]EMB5526212.1 EamA family transporter [Campylobacter coli]
MVLLGGIFWAISGVLAEYLFKNNYGVDWVSFYRLFCTGIVLILYSLKKIKIFQFKKDELLSFLIFAFFGLLMTQYGYFKAIFYTDAGTATMIQYCAPLLIMIYVCLKDKKMPKIFESMALIFIILALFLLASGGDISNLNLNLWGIFWAILGAFGASKEETMKRAIERSKLDRETNIELVETMWKQFSNLGIYELNVIDTTTHSIKDTVSAVQEKIASKRTTLVEESELTHVAAPDNPTKEFENRQERFALYRAMQQLDAETREVIHLRLAGDFSFRDIGDILGHSEVWARVRFYRGKEKLVKIIGGDNNA